MFLKLLIFLLILPFNCYAKIQINITVSSDKNNIRIQHPGHEKQIITSNDIVLFNLTDENLKRGARIELGKTPNDIFLKDPTPYDNLYKKYKWHEVTLDVRVKNFTILDVINEEVTLKTHEHINNTTELIQSKRIMSDTMENTVFSTWSKGNLHNNEIFYNINLFFENGNFSYENKWRNKSVRGIILPIGLSKKGNIEIKSGQTAITRLTATKTILLVRIDYVASFIGSIIANYAHLYGKYHFWAPSIIDIMKAAKIDNEIVTKEFIEIRFYSKPKLNVFDKITGEVLRTIVKSPKGRIKIKH